MNNELKRILLTGADGATLCVKNVKNTQGKIVLNPFNLAQ